MREIKVLFVCLGNICRSPLGEGIFRKIIAQQGLESYFIVDSCGTSHYHIGEPPDPRTIANAQEHGIALTSKGRQISAEDLRKFDYILVMDKSNMKNVLRLDETGEYKKKIMLLRDFDKEKPGEDVPDPYFGGEKSFESVYQIIYRSVENLISHITKNENLKKSE